MTTTKTTEIAQADTDNGMERDVENLAAGTVIPGSW
jgi:hypothetical protein